MTFRALARISFFGLLTLLAVPGCKKDDTDNISVVRTFPLLELKGPTVTTVNLGGTFTDPGVKATLGGKDITPIIRGNVNTSAAGVYTVTYVAKNPEGDSLTVVRSVGVVDPAALPSYPDLTGTYERAATGGIANVTNLGNGLYMTDNLGAVPASSSAKYPAFFIQTSPTDFEMPPQMIPGQGEFDFVDEVITFNGSTVESITYRVLGPGFGAGPRILVKQ